MQIKRPNVRNTGTSNRPRLYAAEQRYATPQTAANLTTLPEQVQKRKAMRSTRHIIRKAMVEIIESKTAKPGDLLKACRLLLKMALAPKGKSRGRGFKKVDRRDRILAPTAPKPN